MKTGIVIKSTGSWYLVKDESGNLIECKIKGNLRITGIRSTNPIAVGDNVAFTESKPENVVAAKEAGVSNYIVKPFNAETLKTKLVSVLGPFN